MSRPSRVRLLVLRRMSEGWSLWHRPGDGRTHLEPPPKDGIFARAVRVAPATFAVLRDKKWIFPDNADEDGRWQLGHAAQEVLNRTKP